MENEHTGTVLYAETLTAEQARGRWASERRMGTFAYAAAWVSTGVIVALPGNSLADPMILSLVLGFSLIGLVAFLVSIRIPGAFGRSEVPLLVTDQGVAFRDRRFYPKDRILRVIVLAQRNRLIFQLRDLNSGKNGGAAVIVGQRWVVDMDALLLALRVISSVETGAESIRSYRDLGIPRIEFMLD